MSAFTDTDLKRLKEEYQERPHPHAECVKETFFCRPCELSLGDEAEKMRALLTRLTASEAALIAFQIIPEEYWTERIRQAFKTWRASCGK
jgi:hypothetical protein